jgi:hypothetical protein
VGLRDFENLKKTRVDEAQVFFLLASLSDGSIRFHWPGQNFFSDAIRYIGERAQFIKIVYAEIIRDYFFYP